uniref:Protein YIPF n=1 Tax=Octactis speculum TaxID=3111310 RepID=A0A7S2AYN4_9STRA|mmetsp:Transcript_17370/g.23417  ORF Transcript_17370/g.23417 Transcript_17370/m.23417 type:complete len:245 (+) Transcript_17370:23-757(+)|eukprot:CAMPEP_0185754230 /NCGR_PEP_ID=MMETSP1174-20130828/12870_1 /TAXON_ID=35687 /ORGANISM="Dictyocha speculum, Strain CCMP1381" /LENGTH=244 /DNA_ID=CAMNT_0028432351 /DNA_START=17 /DNA_END=751 /DNA_ORIENTATION=-
MMAHEDDQMNNHSPEVLLEDGDRMTAFEDEEDSLITRDKTKEPFGLCGCFTIQYYQPFFDVDTVQVFTRLLNTTKFYKKEPTFLTTVTARPDAYGPFWTAATLIFIISATSNLSGYLSKGYTYDFQVVTFCVCLVYGYLVLAPLIVWATLKYGSGTVMDLMPLQCLYGYSLVYYIPFTFIAVWKPIAWTALALALTGSTLLLLRSLVPVFGSTNKPFNRAVPITIVIALQIGFMFCVKLKFYNH